MHRLDSHRQLFVGIDLGTTNSAVATFDGERTRVLADGDGHRLVPSCVFADEDRVLVGHAARARLARDPSRGRTEFKRLMGSTTRFPWPTRTSPSPDLGVPVGSIGPEELAAQVLATLRRRVERAVGFPPRRAVIGVPAAFELPQSAATSRAAEAAGFESVELIQEPIASAMAAGWRRQDGDGHWLVYDLGGGTFDVSLLESDDGFLRVVGHAGDNVLGGRDLDAAIVAWVLDHTPGPLPSLDDPEHRDAIATLRRAAERAKITLSGHEETVIEPAPLRFDGLVRELRVRIDRARLAALAEPLIARTCRTTRGLLETHGVDPARLRRVVLIGGPTLMPGLAPRVAREFGAPVSDDVDPMTAVARGAALFAASARLDARPTDPRDERERNVWLRHPALTTDPSPFVVGRVLAGRGTTPTHVEVWRDRDQRRVEARVDADGGFGVQIDLEAHATSRFHLRAFAQDVDGRTHEVRVHPSRFEIVHGVTVSDPPLGVPVGVALADDRVRTYFERGTPLPARRRFSHRVVDAVAPGQPALRVPIVQGPYERAHLCRVVGVLELGPRADEAIIEAGTPVEVVLELDRGGRLTARALAGGRSFEHVATLLVPAADPEVVAAHVAELETRAQALHQAAFRLAERTVLARLEHARAALLELHIDVRLARGGDADAAQRALRHALEVDAELVEAESTLAWPELERDTFSAITFASAWVPLRGTPREADLLGELVGQVESARRQHDPDELQRITRLIAQLGESAWLRDPAAWRALFERAASDLDNAHDLPAAHALVERGRRAIERDDDSALREVVRKLRPLLPAHAELRRLGHDSGVR